MKRSKRSGWELVIALLLFGGALIAPSDLAGMMIVQQASCAEPDVCGPPEGDHVADPDPNGDFDGPHEECLFCTDGKNHQPWWVCHGTCLREFEDESDAAQYLSVIEAANEGNLLGVLVAGRLLPGIVRLNEARGSLQIVGCDDRIVANLPLQGDALLLEMAREAEVLALDLER